MLEITFEGNNAQAMNSFKIKKIYLVEKDF